MLNAEHAIRRSRSLRALAMGTAVVALIWFVSEWIITGEAFTLKMAGLAGVVCLVMLCILNDWRSGIYLFLIWLLFEDLARKFLGNNMVIYFGKDALAAVTYFSLLMALRRGQAQAILPRFLPLLGSFFGLGLIQVFNPNSPSLLYGLLGLKLYFYYVPLFFVGYAFLRSESDFQRFLRFNLLLAAIIAVLGLVQAIKGPSFLNPTVLAPELRRLGSLTRMAPISGALVFRPTSVFVSDGRFAWYLVMSGILGFGVASYLLLRVARGRKLVFLAFALIAGAVAMSGSRGALMWCLGSALVMAAAFVWGAPWRWQQGHRLVKAIRRAFLLGALALVFLVLFFPQALGARLDFYSETLLPESPTSELVQRGWDYPLRNLGLAFQYKDWLTGYGIGTASLGVQYVSRMLGQGVPAIGVESGFGTLIVELGILGPVLWLGWVGSLLLAGWRIVRSLKATAYFPIGFAILWFAFLLLVPFTFFGMQPYQNYVLNAYLWFLTGILFRLPRLCGQPSFAEARP